jgi:hypothetical protein
MVWTNSPARVFHGTTLSNAKNIIKNDPDPTRGRAAADFGQGFYVTSVLHQAQQWANLKVRNLPPHLSDKAAVVEFDMNRDVAGQLGDHLTFVVADSAFHDFVLFNRLGSATHGRGQKGQYDLVYGPVAAFPQTLTYANCDQICFLSQRAVQALTARGNPSEGNPYFP